MYIYICRCVCKTFIVCLRNLISLVCAEDPVPGGVALVGLVGESHVLLHPIPLLVGPKVPIPVLYVFPLVSPARVLESSDRDTEEIGVDEMSCDNMNLLQWVLAATATEAHHSQACPRVRIGRR